MKCFRHPAEAAAVFCKGCGKPLCLECCRRSFGNETHVCSEDCARTVSLQPDSGEARENMFQTVYAAIFLTVLLGLLGGGLSLWMIKHAIFAEELETRIDAEMRRTHFIGRRYYCVKIFYALGITNWKPQFGIGAAVGAGSAMLFMAKCRSDRKAGR
jgi:hypothetical protein